MSFMMLQFIKFLTHLFVIPGHSGSQGAGLGSETCRNIPLPILEVWCVDGCSRGRFLADKKREIGVLPCSRSK